MERNISLRPDIPPMTYADIERVRQVEAFSKVFKPQIRIEIEHTLHAGMYLRTARIAGGVMITGALIKVPTVVIVNGDCTMFCGGDFQHIKGYAVLKAEAGRKGIWVAHSDTVLTMCFPTDAKTVKEAEERFTDEINLLQSREV